MNTVIDVMADENTLTITSNDDIYTANVNALLIKNNVALVYIKCDMMLVKIYIEQKLTVAAIGWEFRGTRKAALANHFNGNEEIGTGTMEPH